MLLIILGVVLLLVGTTTLSFDIIRKQRAGEPVRISPAWMLAIGLDVVGIVAIIIGVQLGD